MRAAIGLGVGLALTAPAAFAGGLGMQVAFVVAALIVAPRPDIWALLARRDAALAAALAFLVWATVTQLWSPGQPRQIAIVWLEVALGAGLLLAAARLRDRLRRWPRVIFVGLVTGLAVALAIEAATGGAFTAMVKGMEPRDSRVFSMLGRGASATIMLLPAACAMALGMGRAGLAAIAAMLAGGAMAAIGFEVQANQFAIVIAFFAFLVAWRFPRAAILSFAGAFTLWLALFPLGVQLMDPVIEPRRDAMPFSWEWRWEAWSYAVELIRERPLFGWGADATRTLGGATIHMRGFELSRIPLHTHAASLQIWLETGAVGVTLACAALVLGARRVARGALGRPRAAAAVASAAAMAFLLSASYGFWQEWFWCGAMLVAAACFLAGPGPDAADAPETGGP